jgi:hypothetical protein
MAWTVELYDPITTNTYDITDRVLKIATQETLDKYVTQFKLMCHSITNAHLFHYITIYKDAVSYLTGIVITQNDSDGGGVNVKFTEFVCEDWGYLLTKRMVAKTYTSDDAYLGRPDLILKNIISMHLPEFTTNNIQICNSTLDKTKFDYIPVKEAFETIFQQLDYNWHWYIDKDKDVHTFYKYETTGMTFHKQNINVKTLSVNYMGQDHINTLWVIGKKQASANYIDEFFTLDGSKRHFLLAYEPNYYKTYVNVGAGYVEKNVKLEENNDKAQDFLINKANKLLFIPDNIATPPTGTLKIHYRPTKQFIDKYENQTDVSKYGLLEKVVKNNNITDKIEARRYGKSEVKKGSSIIRKVSFESSYATNLKLGQNCTIYINEALWDIDGQFLVTSISREIYKGNETTKFELEELI